MMEEGQDLERGDENREMVARGDLRRQRRINNWRHRTGLPRRSITSTANSVVLLVTLVGLLLSFFGVQLELIQVKYQNSDASSYKTHPLSMAICLVALSIFASAVGFKIMFQNWAARIIIRVILISGALVAAALAAVLVTTYWLSWIIYIIWVILSIMMLAWNSIPLINNGAWLYERTENAFFRVINVFKRLKQRLMITVGRRMLVEPQGPSNV